MKLESAIIAGKFCGLETVEECYCNASRFMGQMYPYDQVAKEQLELDQEMAAYEADYGAIDWDRVEEEITKTIKSYEKWCEEHYDEELEIPEGWQSG